MSASSRPPGSFPRSPRQGRRPPTSPTEHHPTALHRPGWRSTALFTEDARVWTAIDTKAATITVFCDNARYYRSKAVRAYLEHSRIDLQFLPPYAPNLNLIERFWKFFKRQVLYNRYYETFADYKAACKQFFADLDAHAEQLRSLLTDNFEIIRSD